ncbi:hypothetical protein AVEN_24228-1, partial [Araneus ventricosus]
ISNTSQFKDPKLNIIRENIFKTGYYKNFEIRNGILYKRNYDLLGRNWLLFLPKLLREHILKSFHDAPTAGHIGFAKTYAIIKGKFYWPGVYRSVRRYVSHCNDCKRRNSPQQRPAGLLQPIEPVNIPFFKNWN